MDSKSKSNLSRVRRARVRKKIAGTNTRPRMSVKFSGKNIYVQFIDDEFGRTLTSVNSLKERASGSYKSTNVSNAKIIGEKAARSALAIGIRTIVFDRGCKLYHGRIKALADAAREVGLKF